MLTDEQKIIDDLRKLTGFLLSDDVDGLLPGGFSSPDDAADLIECLQARVKVLEKALQWYGEQARLAKLIHSEGDSGRNALAKDGGKRARTALQEQSK
jgi:hypothetical protein